jgi:hypothetical protein
MLKMRGLIRYTLPPDISAGYILSDLVCRVVIGTLFTRIECRMKIQDWLHIGFPTVSKFGRVMGHDGRLFIVPDPA